MDFDALIHAFRSLQSDPALTGELDLLARADALDTLTFIDDIIQHNPNAQEFIAITGEVQRLRQHLKSLNNEVFNELRERLKSSEMTKSTLRALFDTCTNYKPGELEHIHIDYEALDVLLAGTLFPSQAPLPEMELHHEMVHWEASPGSVILDLLDHVTLQTGDVFYDMGSGLGNVAILVNLLSGIKTVGIERDPAYWQYAQNLASEFSLDLVTFVNTDARDADLSSGTVFYLFTPFMASILRDVMGKLHQVAQQHPIYVCSFGPCTSDIAQLSWLHNTNGDDQHEFKLAIFKSGEKLI